MDLEEEASREMEQALDLGSLDRYEESLPHWQRAAELYQSLGKTGDEAEATM